MRVTGIIDEKGFEKSEFVLVLEKYAAGLREQRRMNEGVGKARE